MLNAQTTSQLAQTPENAEQQQCSDNTAMLRQMNARDEKKEDVQEEKQEKEEEKEEKASKWTNVIMKMSLKPNTFVIEIMQNKLKIMLCWVTPYMCPAQNTIYNNEHPKIMNSLCVRLRPKLEQAQCSDKTNAQTSDDNEKENMDEEERRR